MARITREKVDQKLLDLLPALRAFVPPATVFDKDTYSAFSDGRLHKWLLGETRQYAGD